MIVVTSVKKPPEPPPRPSWHMEGPLWLPDYETTDGGILVPCQLADVLRNGRDSFCLGVTYFVGGGDMRRMSIAQVPAATAPVMQWEFSPPEVAINRISLV